MAQDLTVGTVVINVRDLGRAVRFWQDALGYRLRPSDDGDDFVMLLDPAGHLPLSLQRTDRAPDGPARIHLDLYTADQQGAVERLVGLGATRVEDWPYPDDPDFVVLRDPDGNEFCVIDHPQ